MKILLIDDSEADRALIAECLHESGEDFEIIQATGGGQGQEMLTTHMPDCIILDFMMPDDDGFHWMLDAKKHHETLPPVIFVTGFNSPEMAEDAVALGAVKFISKEEIGSDVLAQAVREVVENHPRA